MRKTFFSLLSLLVVLSMMLSGCAAAQARDMYDKGQTLYIGADQAYADFVLCQVTENQTLEQSFAGYYAGLWSDIQQKKEYRSAKDAAVAAANQAQTAVAKDGSKVIDFNTLPQAATPNGVYSGGLAFSVYAVQEAQVAAIAPEMYAKLMDAVQVSNNHKFQCGKTWNQAASAYNLWRRQVEGRVVGDLAEYFNIEDMPKELPLFTVEGFNPGQAPNTDNPYKPTP